ncbi:MAG: electron transfer flavoprotein subunit alpha/FixB family protein [Candidatus Aminicenantes bacterium]|nr:electron transfer flavoprotein subunit alpha/FixB family protein [Candidatus Aminicenantes bacterium]
MILVYIEAREGKIKKASLEALSEARRRADELNLEIGGALLGSGLEAAAAEVFARGAHKAFLLEGEALDAYSAQAEAAALEELVKDARPEAVFFSATARGKDLAPRLAARLGVSLASDCTRLEVKDGRIEYTRPIFAGKALLSFRLKSAPQIASLRPNVFPLLDTGRKDGEVVKRAAAVRPDQVRGRVTEVRSGKGGALDVTEAEVIFSGGRGMKGPENFALLEELSGAVPRSAVGASRSAVDSGWIDHHHQVGQTGKTVSPNVYFAFGISGAIQHLAGMSSSKVIVAVNKDPEAPIFKAADYGIVGDLFQVIPPLKEELKKLLEE